MDVLRGDIVWSLFRKRNTKDKLDFLKKIEKLSEERWVRKIPQENGKKINLEKRGSDVEKKRVFDEENNGDRDQ